MAGLLTLEFKSTLESVASATEAAERWLVAAGASKNLQYLVNLAMEELATNCIKYGYDDDPNGHSLAVVLSFTDDTLVLTFTDDGHPFNPLLVPNPDLHASVEERAPGGLGIYLLRQMFDGMEYVREGATNKVTLRKASNET